jgi:hypothetical protein
LQRGFNQPTVGGNKNHGLSEKKRFFTNKRGDCADLKLSADWMTTAVS